MEHVVFFPAADGGAGFRRVAGIDEAIALVEHLRNVEGRTEVSVHALTEVPLTFRSWFRVEVAPVPAPESASESAPEPAPEPALVPAQQGPDEDPATGTAPEPAALRVPCGRRLVRTDLGFFA